MTTKVLFIEQRIQFIRTKRIWVQYHYIQLTLKDGILALEKVKVC